MQPLVLTLEQLAAALQCSTGMARLLCVQGAIRARKLGKTWRIPFAAVEEYLSGGDNVETPPQAQTPPLVAMGEEQKAAPSLADHLKGNPSLLEMVEADERPKRGRKRKEIEKTE